jgi:hypothetical protein
MCLCASILVIILQPITNFHQICVKRHTSIYRVSLINGIKMIQVVEEARRSIF